VRTDPNGHVSSEPLGVDVLALIGTESQWYRQEASKIWRSFLPGFTRMCCGVMKQRGTKCQIQWGMWMT
jgi:hypothetical protein